MLTYEFIGIDEVKITGYNGNVTSIDIPESIEGRLVTTIGIYSFKNMFSLERISLPDTIQSIGDNAFEYCVKLKEIIIPDNVEYIGSNAFNNCVCLKKVKVPKKTDKISNYAFSNCKNLREVTLPCTATVGYGVFLNCSDLTVYYEPKEV